MDHETKTSNYETKTSTNSYSTHQSFSTTRHKLPKGERRVRFADSMGMELVSIFLIDLINSYYFASFHHRKALTQTPASSSLSSSSSSSSYSTSTTTSAAAAAATSTAAEATRNTQSQQQQQSTLTAPRPAAAYTAATASYKPSSTTPAPTIIKSALSASCQLASSLLHKSPAPTIAYSNSGTGQLAPATGAATAAQFNYECEFIQPISLVSFRERVKMNKVQLATCQINSAAGHVSVSCTIRVLNLAYDKSVLVRYTTDDWHTHSDSLASYKPGSSNDGWSDTFTSTFTITQQVKSFQTGQRIIFAVRYQSGGQTVYWDNNGGLNYAIKKV